MRLRTEALLALPALFLLLALSVSVVRAQSTGPAIMRNEAIVDFPHTVTFQLELPEGTTISEAILTYQLDREGCLKAGTQVPVEIDGSTLEWTWVMSRSGNPPPGAGLWWEWTFSDGSGNTFTTPRETLTFRDERFDWRTVEAVSSSSAAPIRLHWYEGDEVGPVLLEAAVAGLDRLEQDAGISLQGDVEMYIYGSAADMREALLYVQDWAGGAAISDYSTVLLGVPPDIAESWGRRTVRHELTHLALEQFGRSCLGGSRPTWLEEGLATYAEGEPDEQTVADIENGVQNNTFQPVRSLNGSFPAQRDEVTGAYSQSYSLVDFLLANYGREKLQELVLTLAAAEQYDAALEQVYGFNADGLETAWREAIGAPPRPIPPTPTPLLAANIPTVVPLDAARRMPTPGSGAPAAETTIIAAPEEPTRLPATDESITAPVTTAAATATLPTAATATAPAEQPEPAVEPNGESSGICGLAVAPLMFIAMAMGARSRRARKGRRG
jgi:hypothetical protein